MAVYPPLRAIPRWYRILAPHGTWGVRARRRARRLPAAAVVLVIPPLSALRVAEKLEVILLEALFSKAHVAPMRGPLTETVCIASAMVCSDTPGCLHHVAFHPRCGHHVWKIEGAGIWAPAYGAIGAALVRMGVDRTPEGVAAQDATRRVYVRCARPPPGGPHIIHRGICAHVMGQRPGMAHNRVVGVEVVHTRREVLCMYYVIRQGPCPDTGRTCGPIASLVGSQVIKCHSCCTVCIMPCRRHDHPAMS